jgi:hypothetical protein
MGLEHFEKRLRSMTLIITEISEHGISMVADSAVTTTVQLPSGNVVSQVLNGARKLQVVPHLRAGISVWGLGEVKTGNRWIPADLWIHDFINTHNPTSSLDDFATQLAQELQLAVGDVKEPMGLHLAGYVDHGGEMLPTIYHIRNCDGTHRHYDLHDFVPGLQYPPSRLYPGELRQLRNGDYGPYAILSEVTWPALEKIKTVINLEIPYPSLEGRMSYLSTWVTFVSDLYASSGLYRTIGGKIASLGIKPDGETIYHPGS